MHPIDLHPDARRHTLQPGTSLSVLVAVTWAKRIAADPGARPGGIPTSPYRWHGALDAVVRQVLSFDATPVRDIAGVPCTPAIAAHLVAALRVYGPFVAPAAVEVAASIVEESQR